METSILKTKTKNKKYLPTELINDLSTNTCFLYRNESKHLEKHSKIQYRIEPLPTQRPGMYLIPAAINNTVCWKKSAGHL